jgi:hypothetical protein
VSFRWSPPAAAALEGIELFLHVMDHSTLGRPPELGSTIQIEEGGGATGRSRLLAVPSLDETPYLQAAGFLACSGREFQKECAGQQQHQPDKHP